MTNLPKVSVLMPVYKTPEKYLREAIESILAQTFADFEFLILDDYPEQSVEDIVKSYDDKRIKYSKNDKNLGITPSRNKLIDMAQGQYLAVMDHDDISLPTRFAKQVEFLDNHSDYGVVGCIVECFPKKKITTNPTDDANIRLALIRVCAVTHPASMIRKSILIENNIRYEEKFSPAEDYVLWCRLIPYTKFYNIPEVLFNYRNHQENTSHKHKNKMRQAMLAIHSFAKENNPALYNEFLLKAKHINRIYLFGSIPFIKIMTTDNCTKGCLFEKILLWKSNLKEQV